MPDVVLVVGGAGFIGARLQPALHAAGYSVRVHGRQDGPLTGADLTRVTRVVNLAGRTYVPDSWVDPLPFYRDNVLTAVEALSLCRATGAALVHVSSYVYGVPRRLPIPEDHPLSAANPYAHTKILAEQAVTFHREHFGVTAAVIRPFNVYGAGQDGRFVIPSILRQLLDDSVGTCQVADFRPRRDYLHVDDLVALIVLALQARSDGTYNAGSGASTSIHDIIDRLARLTGVSKPWKETGETRKNEVLDVIADVSRAAADLRWVPSVTLDEGLRRMIDGQRPERIQP
jgi:nucleoside-diphosphate-sugar epimerase